MKTFVVIEEIRKVVEAVSLELLPLLQVQSPTITGVHYDHGHPIEIIETLREKDETDSFKFKRYPLIALFQDFPETERPEVGTQSEVTLHIIIAMTTQPEYKAGKRYEKNFLPILYPIYDEFKNQMYRSKAFRLKSRKLDCTKYDRLYWGREGLLKNERNIFNDFIDCIELKNLKLKVNDKLC